MDWRDVKAESMRRRIASLPVSTVCHAKSARSNSGNRLCLRSSIRL